MQVPRTATRCPGCGGRMLSCVDDTGLIAGCDACGSVWLDRRASRRLISAELSTAAMDFIREISSSSADVSDAPYRAPARSAERACPFCGDPLTTVQLRTPNIVIDTCALHGSYLDRGEVGMIWAEASVQASLVHIRKADTRS